MLYLNKNIQESKNMNMMKKQDKNFKGKTHTKNLKLKEFEIERPNKNMNQRLCLGYHTTIIIF